MIGIRRLRGVALLTALLIVALSASLAGTLAWDNALDMRRTTILLYRDEAVQAALGAENWVSSILNTDIQDSDTDHLGEIWATEIPVLPIESDSIQGQISGEIEDLQGRFNINNLVSDSGEVDQESLDQFRRLLQSLGLDPRFAGVAADWVDSNQEAEFPDGAEDSIYSGMLPPYRAANQMLSTTTELFALDGMDKDTFDILEPHITALPRTASGPTRINANTATGPVLQSLGDDISVADVEGLIAERGEVGFADLQKSFATLLNRNSGSPNPQNPDIVQTRLSETSEFFQLKVIVQVDTVRITYYTMLYRDNQGVTRPVLRTLGTT